MSALPRRPCGTPGCMEFRPCPRHYREFDREYDRHRPSARRRGYDSRHERWRLMVLARDNYRCRECGYSPADDSELHADHIVPISQGGAQLEPANGQALCAACHGVKTRREAGGAR